MNMSVVGTGYVGLVAGACFSDSGNDVVCVDCDEGKIKRLLDGEMPIYEPGLSEIVIRGQKAGRLKFTTDLSAAVKHGRLIFIAVGTPQADDGSADLSAILDVAATIGREMDGYRVIVMKSTVPVGTYKKVTDAIRKQTDHPFDYVSNPEFLKEGAAIEDFMRPDRVVIGASNPAAAEIMRELYAPFMRRDERMFIMDPASAEMTKYAANAMLATRISFMNEIACLCEHFGADVENVRRGVGSDSRIGSAFLFPGVGYGGSCFPKDVSALISMGKSVSHPASIAQAAQDINIRQRTLFAHKVIDHFKGRTSETTIAVWGLAFKSRTDDVREAPAIAAIEMFLEQGMAVRAHDPEAMGSAAALLGPRVTMCDDSYETLDGADALVVFTDWPKFRNPDFDVIADKLKNKLIFDGRNLYDPPSLAKRGFRYVCIGRPTLSPM
ncbi:MAG: UDP-glucose/GDP-mannose dehydrogenase family protein [Planctomycetes bacterium]|nr:UDP-glucose/GDP-mannose dehydrogenase family protein [Planctomycetota bacterium]